MNVHFGDKIEAAVFCTEVVITFSWVRTKHFSPQKEHVVFRVCDTERIKTKVCNRTYHALTVWRLSVGSTVLEHTAHDFFGHDLT